MKREFIRLMATIINETGINVIDQTLNRKFLRYLFLTGMVTYAIFTLFMFSFTNRGDFYDMMSTATYIGGGTIAVAGVAAILYYKSNVRQMLHQMDDNIFTYSDEHLVTVDYKWYLNEKNGITLYYLVMAIELMGYIMICGMSIAQWISRRELTFYVFPSWTPWPETGIKSKFAALITQHFMTLCGLYLYYVSLLFITIVTMEFNRQFYRLNRAICSLSHRTGVTVWNERYKETSRQELPDENIFRDVNNLSTRFDLQFGTEFNRVFKNNLQNCIQHHQLLMKNHKLFQPLFGVIYSFELACCMMTFALGLYCLLDVRT